MNENANFNAVPHHGAHAHFYDWIEFGDHLPVGDSLDDMHKKNMTKLRQQYLYDSGIESKLCLRNCFKLSEKRYVEFCLSKKCGGVGFNDAARTMGYLKN